MVIFQYLINKNIYIHKRYQSSYISHYNDVIMSTIASHITSLTIVYPIVNSGADQRKHQSSASLAFVWGIHRWPVNSPHKRPVTRKMFPFDDVTMCIICLSSRVWLILEILNVNRVDDRGIYTVILLHPDLQVTLHHNLLHQWTKGCKGGLLATRLS